VDRKSTANKTEGLVVTLGEVASLLRISRGSAYEAAKRREIPTIRIGRRLLVPSAALERLLSGNVQPLDRATELATTSTHQTASSDEVSR
jgi:excisionase family DNA binding protein